MNVVHPIRDVETVKRVLNEARKIGDAPYLLMKIGFHTGLRISDILPLRAVDIRAEAIVLFEKKTGKKQRIEMNPAVKAELEKLVVRLRDGDLLFPSPQLARRGRPVDYTTAYGWVNKACRRAGISGAVGCHTMRKTFGYRFYTESGGDVALLMRRFNHANQVETLRYIGVEGERINKIERKIRF